MSEDVQPEQSSSNADVGAPDIPAYTHDGWRGRSKLPGTVSVAGSRAELAANRIVRLAAGLATGDRIGSKDDLRRLTGVSVGTVNEAIKLAQARGVITSRPGPGGGLFVADPSPLARMNSWFRSAASDSAALGESIAIRDALAPMLVDEVLAGITDDDQDALDALAREVSRTRDGGDVAAFIWAVWNVHERFAQLGRSQLLDSLYLSIMDVGTSHLRAQLVDLAESGEARTIQLTGLARVTLDFVAALAVHDREAAVAALCATDPTMILRSE